ncbi:MAG: hypothetical protein IJW77_04740 [Clostridia bacterium]|nr:hypothetical protein [Clostridia bacterium]
MTCKGRVNRKRTVLKITVIVFLLCLPVLLITLYYTSSKISWNPYLDEYKNDYIHRFDYELTVRGWFTTSINRYSRIWFLPSQKDKMLNAIMEDIKNLMPEIQELNEEIIVDYEFSEDFRRVILYVIPPKLALPESPTNEVDVTRPIYIANSVYFTDEMNKRLDIYCEILYGYPFHDDKWNVIEYRYIAQEAE